MTMNSVSARALGGPLDLGVAALAAVSVGFVTFAMPEALFSSLVTATRLPELLAAAAPPLGMTARYAAMAGGSLAVFLIVWSLLRSLDGASANEADERPAKRESDPDAPRLRRADAHPDAPARRPIFAGADFGEPDNDVYELDRPAPFTGPAHQPEGHSGFEPEPEFEPEPASPAAAVESAPQPAPAGRMPRFLVTDAEEAAPTRDPVLPAARKRPFEAVPARLPETEATRQTDSIGSLMNRLERGLVEREEPRPAPLAEPDLPEALAAASADPEASLSPEGVRHRLRSAISELNQRASRG